MGPYLVLRVMHIFENKFMSFFCQDGATVIDRIGG